MKATLVFVSAKKCGFCKDFKKIWPGIKTSLAKEKITVLDPEVEEMHSMIPESYPRDLRQNVRWFPFICLIHPTDMEMAMKDPNYPIRFAVFNGIVTDGVVSRNKESQIKYTHDDIIAWAKKTSIELSKLPPRSPTKGNVQTPKSVTTHSPDQEKQREKERVFEIHSSIFVPTCNRNANIGPTVRNGGF